MTMLDKYNLVELLGIEKLPQETLNQIVSKTVELIYRRVFQKIDDSGLISQETKTKAVEMEEQGKPIEEIQQFISENIPNFTDLVIQETDLMKMEMLKDQLQKIKPLITDETDLQVVEKLGSKLSNEENLEEDFEQYKKLRDKYNFV
ncbi:hypothetical protein HYV12_00720 [Candidatus Dojkabacteria bacterium]|nr:hypothetical protein [Candidatus Dojkabacteria bacterium]